MISTSHHIRLLYLSKLAAASKDTNRLGFTGLSASGKSTIANIVERTLNEQFNAYTYLLDGDILRSERNNDLGFSTAGRTENIRRVGETAKLMADAGLSIISAFTSPLQADRERNRELAKNYIFMRSLSAAQLKFACSVIRKDYIKRRKRASLSNSPASAYLMRRQPKRA